MDIGITSSNNDLIIEDDEEISESKISVDSGCSGFKKLIPKFLKKKKTQNESLDIVVSSIYEAVQKAQKSIQLNNINRLEYYFEIDEDNHYYKPKTIKMELPSREHSGNDIIDVPLFALVHHHSLNISEFTVKLKANIGGCIKNSENGRLKLNNHLLKNNFQFVTNVTKLTGNTADIEIKCNISEPPEFISRMSARFDKLL